MERRVQAFPIRLIWRQIVRRERRRAEVHPANNAAFTAMPTTIRDAKLPATKPLEARRAVPYPLELAPSHG